MSITPPKNNPYLFCKSYRIYTVEGSRRRKIPPSHSLTSSFIHSLSVSPASSPLCSGSRWVSHLLSSDRLPGHHHQSPILLLAHIPQGRTYTDLSECSVEPELSPHWCRHHPGPPRRTRCLDQQSEESSRRRAPKGRTHPVRTVLEQDHLAFCDKDRSRWKEIN